MNIIPCLYLCKLRSLNMIMTYKTNSLRLCQHILSALQRAFAVQQNNIYKFLCLDIRSCTCQKLALHGVEDLCVSCLNV